MRKIENENNMNEIKIGKTKRKMKLTWVGFLKERIQTSNYFIA